MCTDKHVPQSQCCVKTCILWVLCTESSNFVTVCWPICVQSCPRLCDDGVVTVVSVCACLYFFFRREILNGPTLHQCVWCLHRWNVCFLKRHIQHNNECKHLIKGKNEFFFPKSLKLARSNWDILHTCPQHLKLMPTTSLSHILHNEETRDNTFDYIFHSQLKTMLLNFSDYLIWIVFPVSCDLSCLIMHRY